ncbi:hypothetical protein V8E36_009465 [Tilletia maclaganii]
MKFSLPTIAAAAVYFNAANAQNVNATEYASGLPEHQPQPHRPRTQQRRHQRPRRWPQRRRHLQHRRLPRPQRHLYHQPDRPCRHRSLRPHRRRPRQAPPLNGVQYRNLLVRPINSVLTIPGNLTQLAQLLTQAELLEDSDDGLTIFAPTNAAIQAIQSTASQLNQTQLQALLAQHVLNGTVAYSTLIPDNAINAAGQRLTFIKNGTGAFVQLANTTAKITQTDILFRGGVVHTIDAVLVDTATNTTAANDAFNTASTAAPTPTAGGTNGSGGSGGNNNTGAASPAVAKLGGGLLGLTLVASAVFTLL